MMLESASLIIDDESVKDVKNIAQDVYWPLSGFLKEKDFLSVVKDMRLQDGRLWPIPIVLDIREPDFCRLRNEKTILLQDKDRKSIAFLQDIEFYQYDKEFLIKNVFQVLDRNHPGVAGVWEMGDYLIGGEIKLLDESRLSPFEKYNLTPQETKQLFQKKGWKTIVAFQTRNVPHCGHEFLQKEALKEVDGLFVQPVIGEKKLADFKDEFIIGAYEVLIDKYYPKEKVLLGILPLKMRYAGPREAVFHALIRKNFGCSHFIVGRDHAGVGKYYGPYDAQKIFDDFKKEELGIEILKYPEVVFCQACQKHTFEEGCPHSEDSKISFSGTRLRENIQKKEQPPFYIIRPEVYEFLANSDNPLVDALYKNKNNKQKGFVLWLTGLPCSGKTTIADKVNELLKERGFNTERLDGDVVRQYLSQDLGFSKKDRDRNLERVGFICQLLSRNKVAVLASFVSPYRYQRQKNREMVDNFIEVFVNAPLEICQQRDVKGLYQKAKEGIIKNFTGISDPYEEPENPEIEVRTDIESIDECAQKILDYLSAKGYL